MYIKEIVEKAKNGDKECVKILVEYYENYYVQKVQIYFGEETSEDAKKRLPILIKKYVDSDYKISLYNFLRNNAKTFYKKKRKPQKKNIGEKVTEEDKTKFNYVLNHYSDSFYKKVKVYNTFLTDEELKELSNEFIKKTILVIESNNLDFRVNMNIRISKELAIYKKDSNKIVKRYILLLGPNERLIKYYCDEYKDLLEVYKYKRNYKYLCDNFGKIIIDGMSRNKQIYGDFKKSVERELYKYSLKKYISPEEETLLIRNNKMNLDDVYKNNEYVKKIIYNKYKNKFNLDEDVFIFLIDTKYKKFIKAYINGTSETKVSSYLNNRLSDYFKKCKPLTKESEKLINLAYYEYHSLIEEELKKSRVNYSLDSVINMLEETFIEYVYEYYLTNKKINLEKYFKSRLDKQIKSLSTNYSDDDVNHFPNNENVEKIIKKLKN